MQSTSIELADLAVFVVGMAVLIWINYRHIWRIAAAYPARPDEKITDCGLYSYTFWFGFSGTRIGVSPNGMELKKAVLPKLIYVEAFVPWSDVWARQHGDHVSLSFTDVADTELQYNKVLVARMQHQLRREIPFGHVI